MIRPLGVTRRRQGCEHAEQLAAVISLNCDARAGRDHRPPGARRRPRVRARGVRRSRAVAGGVQTGVLDADQLGHELVLVLQPGLLGLRYCDARLDLGAGRPAPARATRAPGRAGGRPARRRRLRRRLATCRRRPSIDDRLGPTARARLRGSLERRLDLDRLQARRPRARQPLRSARAACTRSHLGLEGARGSPARRPGLGELGSASASSAIGHRGEVGELGRELLQIDGLAPNAAASGRACASRPLGPQNSRSARAGLRAPGTLRPGRNRSLCLYRTPRTLPF